ncbi:hypothetical protein [Flaviflagellibacter deserti]|uniref:Oxidoreductase n=1 Tax=Flaviflagellibacter deserti TaxID=2267266 RepID=A0ABV9Z3C5_9HYPH
MNKAISFAAALLLAGSSIAFAQSSGGSAGGGSAGGSVGGGSSIGGGSSVGGGAAMPRAGAASSRAATSGRASTSTAPVDPMASQNNLVSPQSQTGGVSTQTAPGSSIGEQVPVYGTNQLSGQGLANSIDQSSARSRGTACGGTGERSTTVGGTSTSTQSGDCASQEILGAPSIISGSGGGAVDVSRP